MVGRPEAPPSTENNHAELGAMTKGCWKRNHGKWAQRVKGQVDGVGLDLGRESRGCSLHCNSAASALCLSLPPMRPMPNDQIGGNWLK